MSIILSEYDQAEKAWDRAQEALNDRFREILSLVKQAVGLELGQAWLDLEYTHDISQYETLPMGSDYYSKIGKFFPTGFPVKLLDMPNDEIVALFSSMKKAQEEAKLAKKAKKVEKDPSFAEKQAALAKLTPAERKLLGLK